MKKEIENNQIEWDYYLLPNPSKKKAIKDQKKTSTSNKQY